MGEVSRPQERNALLLRPLSQDLHFHILAGGPTVFGMNMKIGYEPHHLILEIRNTKQFQNSKSECSKLV
jgi:hypothetical protein